MKREMKKSVAVLLAIVTITAIFANPLYAAAVSWEAALYKLDSVLLEKLETMSSSDCVDVSVWLQDIDYDEVNQETQQALQTKVSMGKASENVLQLSMCQQNNMADGLLTLQNTGYLAEADVTASQDAQVYIETRRFVAAQAYEEQNTSLYHMLFPAEEGGLLRIQKQQQPALLYISAYAPNILLTLTKDQIYKIVRYACVQSIDYFDNDLPGADAAQEPEIELTAAASVDSSYFHTTGITAMKNKGYTGANVKIGMFESGVPITTQGTKYRQVFDHMIDENNASNTRLHIRPQDVAKGSDHASLVACLLVGKTSSYTGAVPDAQLYCAASSANSVSETYEGIEWLIAQGVNVINFSWIYVNTGNNSYDVYAKWFDHLVYNHSVSIVNAAGNGTVENGTKVNQNRVGRNAMAYNIITVGNYDSYQQTVGTSTAYNTIATLAYKPDLVAPGYRLITPLNTNTGATGTSLSAPIVTGAVAQLCQVFSYFKTKPVALKAFLLAGAVKTQQMKAFDADNDSSNNVDSLSGSWRMGLCRKNGAGMLNALNAYTVLYNSNYFYFPNFGSSNNGYSETIHVTSTTKRLQICLNWLKKNTVSGSDHSTGTVNDASRDTYLLEILDPDGETLYNSWYRYDTKEYIAFTPSRTGTYTVKIQKSGTQGQDVTVAWFQ